MPHTFASLVGKNLSTRKPIAVAIALVAACLLALSFAPFSQRVARAQAKADAPRSLSTAERVTYQRAVEEVYWRHTIWPKENAVAKPSLDAVSAPEQTAANVEDTLRKSEALARRWGRPVTAEQLQAEMTRMARETKQPDVLRELFGALGNDPFVIAEVLARPILVERLARNFFSNETKADAPEASFDSWWAGARQQFAAETAPTAAEPSQTANFSYQLATINQAGAGDTWTPTFGLPIADGTAVWTGTEMIVWGGQPTTRGRTNSGSRYNPATDTWAPTSTVNAPSPRSGHTAVWTGKEMVVWGGCGHLTDFCSLNTGGRYNPSTDSWIQTSTTNAPINRTGHTAVWTGSQMIVWGGCNIGANNGCSPSSTRLQNTGGVYDPVGDTWTPTSTVNAPPPRSGHTAVWTGTEMIIWGGGSVTGGRYNPSSDSWTTTSTLNAPSARAGATAVWTGSEMVVWGGYEGNFVTLNTGARYNPSSDSWTPTSTAGAPSRRFGHTAVWTGAEMIVYGGDLRSVSNVAEITATGGRYDPVNDSWIPTSTLDAPPKTGHVAVWTGTEMIVWSTSDLKAGGRYEPARDSWTPTNNNDSAPEVNTGVWSGTEMVVWGRNPGCSSGCFYVGGRYNPATNSWRPSGITPNTPPAGDSTYKDVAVWTGKEMIVWGYSGFTGGAGEGGRYNPLTDNWARVSDTNAPVNRNGHTAVWTGTEMVIWGGQSNDGVMQSTGGRYNPSTDTWQPVSTASAAAARYLHTAVWTGKEMVVWGGIDASFNPVNTGARYNPSTDSWTQISTVDAPEARRFHTAVWTGNEMVVWGGRVGDYTSPTGLLNTGGRYNPSTDSWQPTSMVGAPAARFEHRAVWNGSTMIVWGGLAIEGFSTRGTYTGSRYDPASDVWTATNTLGAPSKRYAHVQVWTGDSMIVWGGTTDEGAAIHGAIYAVPGAPVPTPTPTPAPTPAPSPIPTPTPAPTPAPTPIPTPTPTPDPTPVPTLTPTPMPSPSPTPSPTPIPISSPTPVPIEPTRFVLVESAPFEEWNETGAVTVRRTGDASKPATVDYETSDGTARQGYDYMAASGTLRFAAGEIEKQLTLILIDDSYDEADETFTLTLSAPTGGAQLGSPSAIDIVIKGGETAAAPNPVDDARFFVRQNYADFLGRVPDASGLGFWTQNIEGCGLSLPCRDVKRIDTSAAFFLSIEFQNTGYLVERMYKAAYGDSVGTTRITGSPAQIPVPVIRRAEFLADSAIIRSGLVVGQTGWEGVLENNKQAFALAFVQRQRFVDAYPLTMTPAAFVDQLNSNVGGALDASTRQSLIEELSGNNTSSGRASVFRKVAENAEVDRRETNRAFVLMQFFGYLQRDPDAAPDTDHTGWKFWLDKLDGFQGDFRKAEMVKAFISSSEYRNRFGQ